MNKYKRKANKSRCKDAKTLIKVHNKEDDNN